MVRKKVGKQRLDKYYHLAKEHGYRARSAFKLLQLNQKYNILDNCHILIDLCAAPGGWLQIASKEMKNKEQIIGIDLSTIKPLPGVSTLQCDITTEECIKELNSILVGEPDVVLNDGAPNVGADWEKDAYTQNELVLHSLRLASKFLKKGGIFVSKIFRSKDYSSLLWVFNQLFESILSTKPLSSRDESAEIFVVCKGFLKPENIDESFFDPEKVFSEIKEERNATAMFKSKNKDGYEDMNFYKAITFENFLTNEELLKTMLTHSKIDFDTKYTQFFEPEIVHQLNDLKVVNLNDLKKIVRKRDKFVKLVITNTEDSVLNELKHLYEQEDFESNEEIVEDDLNWKSNLIRQEIKKQSRKEKKNEKKELIRKANANIFTLPKKKFFDDKLFDLKFEEKNKKAMDIEKRPIVADENSDCDSESFDLDQNEIKTLAKYKDDKENFILNTVDRHVMGEENLPEWFLKEEREFNARLMDESDEVVDKKTRRKEIEALNRRKKKAKRKVDKLLSKNGEEGNEVDEDENKKKNLMRNAFRKTKMKPLLVFPKKGKICIPKTKRKIKLVDRRMKKELRAEKQRLKRKNKK